MSSSSSQSSNTPGASGAASTKGASTNHFGLRIAMNKHAPRRLTKRLRLDLAERAHKAHQIFTLARCELNCPVAAHDVIQGGEAAVVHIGSGERYVAQARHAKPVVVLRFREMRPGVASAATRSADEQRRAALRIRRIARGRWRVSALERVAKIVERRAAADERLLERGERLADIGEHLAIVRGHRSAERALIVRAIAS